METEQLIALLLLIVILLIYGLLSGAQSALFSLKDQDLEEIRAAGDRHSRILQGLLFNPRHTVLSLRIGQCLGLLGCVVTGWWVWRTFGGSPDPFGILVGLPPLTIIVGSTVSRRTFQRSPLLYTHRLTIPLWLLNSGLKPIRWSLQKATEGLLALLAVSSSSRDEDALEREYLGLVAMGRREGVLATDEHRLIQRVFDFADQPVARVMTPRTEMFSLPLDKDLEEVARLVKEAGYSRIPVYRGGKEDVIGILYAKDLLRLRLPNEHPKPQSLEELLHRVYFISTQMGIDKLLREFQRRKLHMAICVDEYGGVAGLVTMEDLLEELFGEIYDEDDLEIRPWEAEGEGVYLVSGRMRIEDLEELLDVKIREPDCQTVAGLVLKILGRLPRRGEEIERDELRFSVDKVSGTRIQAVRVQKIQETVG